jgi:hypothetical protein
VNMQLSTVSGTDSARRRSLCSIGFRLCINTLTLGNTVTTNPAPSDFSRTRRGTGQELAREPASEYQDADPSTRERFAKSCVSATRTLIALNLFSDQELMDTAVLFDKVRNIIGGNRELLETFQEIYPVGRGLHNQPQLMKKVLQSIGPVLPPSSQADYPRGSQ